MNKQDFHAIQATAMEIALDHDCHSTVDPLIEVKGRLIEDLSFQLVILDEILEGDHNIRGLERAELVADRALKMERIRHAREGMRALKRAMSPDHYITDEVTA